MKKIYLMALVVVAMTSCGKEEDIVPGDFEECWFENTYGSTDADLRLQSDFYKRNKIHVVFNDTLRKRQMGVDDSGKPYYEVRLVDIGYGMNNNMNPDTEEISFEYLSSDADKSAGIKFLDEMIVPSLGTPLRPFSFLLVDKINHATLQYGSMVPDNPVIYSGWRCSAIALSGIGSMTEEEKQVMRNAILQSIVVKAIASVDQSLFDKFFSFCEPYYGKYAMYEEAEAFIARYPTMYDVGFLSAYSYGTPYGFPIYNFKARNYDLDDYTGVLFSMTPEEFRIRYADYPIVLKKYDILKKIVEDLGMVF